MNFFETQRERNLGMLRWNIRQNVRGYKTDALKLNLSINGFLNESLKITLCKKLLNCNKDPVLYSPLYILSKLIVISPVRNDLKNYL